MRPLAAAATLAVLLAAGCAEPMAPTPPAPAMAIATLASGMLPAPDGFAWEPSAAIDPTDGRHAIVAVSDGEPGLSVYATSDAGASWTRTVLPVGEGAPGDRQSEWSFMGDPVAWFGPDGTAYVGGLGRTRTAAAGIGALADGADIFVAASKDGGRTFGPAMVVVEGRGTVAVVNEPAGSEAASASTDLHNHDKPWFATGPTGRILAVWNDLGEDYYVSGPMGVESREYAGNEMMASWSDDGGATWSEPSLVDPVSPRAPYPFFAADGGMRIVHGRWNDDGLRMASWDGERWAIAAIGTGLGQPIAAQRPDGTVLVAALDAESRPILWSDEGGSWAATQLAATEADHPVVAVGGGATWTAWYELGEARRYVVRADLDGQAPVVHELAAGLGGFDGEYGHYAAGLAAGPDGALAAWPQHGASSSFPFAWLQVA